MKPRILKQLQRLLPIFLLAAFALLSELHGQTTVSGTVIDMADGEPLIGATVQEKGTSSGTITDLDGSFSLTVSGPSAKLRVSYLGYATQELPVSSSPMTVGMVIDNSTLDVVTVVGYGTQKKRRWLKVRRGKSV